MILEPGAVVGRYEVVRLAGRGGMAEVWQVRHMELGGLAALKVLHASDAGRVRLLREGRIQAGLTHPNTVRVLDTLEVDGRAALVLEWIEGPTLAERLTDGPVSPEVVRRWFRGLCAGLAAAHAAGTIHRDLKPANILLAEAGLGEPGDAGRVPRIADFGVARVMAEESGQTRGMLGTPRYMSPEQLRAAKDVDGRSDVWALGCVLFEMLAGRALNDDEDPIALYQRATAAAWRSEVPAGWPEWAQFALERALEPTLAKRASSPMALLGEAVVAPAVAPTWDGANEPWPAYAPTTAIPAPPGEQRWRGLSPGGAVEIRRRDGTDAVASARFDRGARLLHELVHPALPSVIAREPGLLIVAGVDGPTLREWAKRRRSREECLATFTAVLDALAWLHARVPTVAVRQLDPDAVRWVDGVVRLAEWSLATDGPADKRLGGMTFAERIGWDAPERHGGDGGPEADVYAAGALGLWLLTRAEPGVDVDGTLRVARVDDSELQALLRAMGAGDPGVRISAEQAFVRLLRKPSPEPVLPLVLPEAGPRLAEPPSLDLDVTADRLPAFPGRESTLAAPPRRGAPFVLIGAGLAALGALALLVVLLTGGVWVALPSSLPTPPVAVAEAAKPLYAPHPEWPKGQPPGSEVCRVVLHIAPEGAVESAEADCAEPFASATEASLETWRYPTAPRAHFTTVTVTLSHSETRSP